MGGIKKEKRGGEGKEVRDGQRWGDRDRITKDAKVGGFLQMMTRDLHCVVSNADGWQPSERSSDALQTHRIESEHHGDTQAGIITLFVLLRVHKT